MKFQVSKYQNLITTLLLNGNFMQNAGLNHGKTGLAILFYHLSRATGNHAFEYFAGELIDNISSNLTSQMPVDFENGLTGIGWGIEYLVQHQFLEADTDEILEEIDKQIFLEFLKNKPIKIDLMDGILGTGNYFIMRVKGTDQNRLNIITETNKHALIQIYNLINLFLSDTSILIQEPRRYNIKGQNKSINADNDLDPFFDITWNLPRLIDFLAELYSQHILKPHTDGLLSRLLTPLNSDYNLPILQCNRIILLLSLIKLNNSFQITYGKNIEFRVSSAMIEIQLLTNEIINKLIFRLDDKKYKNELSCLNLSVRNGLSGIAFLHKKLYEETNDLKYYNEYKTLLIRIQSTDFIHQFRYDYLNPNKTNEQKLGLLEGISGLLLATFSI